MDQEHSSSRLAAEIFDAVETIARSCDISPFSDLRQEDPTTGLESNWESVDLAALQLPPHLLAGSFFERLAGLMATGALQRWNPFSNDLTCIDVYRLMWNMVRFRPEEATSTLVDSLLQCLTLPVAASSDAWLGDQSDVQRMAGLLLACLRWREYTDRLLEILLGWLKSGSDDGSREDFIATAALALGCLGCHANTPAVREQLERSVRDPWCKIQDPALWALGQLGAGAATAPVLDAMAVLLGRESGEILPVIARTLRQLGPSAVRRILSSLGRCLGSDNPAVRNRALRAVWSLRADPSLLGSQALADILDPILRLLRDSSISIRETACNAVEALGARAGSPQIHSALTLLIDDDDLGVRLAARSALDGLGLPVSE